MTTTFADLLALAASQKRRRLRVRERDVVVVLRHDHDDDERDAVITVRGETGACLALRAQSTSELAVEEVSEGPEVNTGQVLRYMKRESITEEELNLASRVLGYACGETTRGEASLTVEFGDDDDARSTLHDVNLLDFAEGDTAHIVWNSTLLFLNYFLADKNGACDEYIRGKTLVEIGAGNGLLGIACVITPRLGARAAICTDYNEFCLSAIEKNVASVRHTSESRDDEGKPSSSVTVRKFDWSRNDDDLGLDGIDGDITLVGSAVVYEPSHAIHVARTIDDFLMMKKSEASQRRALICIHEEHYGFHSFLENIMTRGMAIDILRVSTVRGKSGSRVVLMAIRRGK